MEGKKPKIRFKGFSDDWEERKLGEICEFSKGQGYSKNDLVESGTPIILYGRLYTKYQTVIYDVDTYVTDKLGSIYSKGTEVIVPASGETAEDIARASAVLKSGILLGGDLNIIYPNSFSNVDSNFLALSISNGGQQKKLAKRAQGKSVVHLRNSDLKEFVLVYPNIREQYSVGIFFQNLDNLITLRKRKYDKLVNVKKSMLEKMFPKNGEEVPEIRFKGFSGKWEKQKYSKTFSNIPNNTLSRAELNYESGIAKNIHYGDVLIKYGELLDVKMDKIPYITNSVLSNKAVASALQCGDVIMADAAEDETVGKCTEIVNVGEEIVIAGLHTIPSRPFLSFASGYLGFFMNSIAYHNQLLKLMQGTKVSSISKSALQDTDIFYPKDIFEQEKISKFFQQLNNLIALQQRELEKLKNIKKSLLEKMFA